MKLFTTIKTPHGNKTERIHALDSLRAIMMLLGVVIHSAITYGTIDFGAAWSLKDPQTTHLSMDFIVLLIHDFRMPIFFMVAGFFGALLFFERGPKKMLQNRINRILYPFIVFVLILSPVIIFAFSFSEAVFSGIEKPISKGLEIFSNPLSFIPLSTYHMWFLYYLFLITILSYLLGFIFESFPRFTNWTTSIFNKILNNSILKVILFATLTIGLLFIIDSTWVSTSTSWIPDWKTFLFYFFFYAFGWILFKSKTQLDTFLRFDWLFTILGFVIFTAKFFLSSSLSFELGIVINSFIVWLFIFGITGLFLRYGSQHSHIMRYNSDSSYWIYLIHLFIVAFIPGIIVSWQIPAIFKFVFVFVIGSIICVTTYHYLVRSTFIGKFLNGRKYPRNIHTRLKSDEKKG